MDYPIALVIASAFAFAGFYLWLERAHPKTESMRPEDFEERLFRVERESAKTVERVADVELSLALKPRAKEARQ